MMEVRVFENSDALGKYAAESISEKLNRQIAETGRARIVLSTGASQFDMFKYLVTRDVDWEKVTMFHLYEYLGLPE